ncbi:hypothetical protein F5141DRAFT_1117386 [Pisolithus sp. B1]|nr:hypothetical protein F5141DRAFT_1117386 [Pisolithus sp. B1]
MFCSICFSHGSESGCCPVKSLEIICPSDSQMHPQLSDKRIVCREFIQALDACHTNNWARLTGRCNQEKDKLNQCLRKERVERSARNRADAKEQRSKTERAWKELHEND